VVRGLCCLRPRSQLLRIVRSRSGSRSAPPNARRGWCSWPAGRRSTWGYSHELWTTASSGPAAPVSVRRPRMPRQARPGYGEQRARGQDVTPQRGGLPETPRPYRPAASLPARSCHHRIMAQLVSVVEVLVATRNPEHPLARQRQSRAGLVPSGAFVKAAAKVLWGLLLPT